ncbi:hypothetical protein Psi02_72330 [Planotetraspora silvatica]|uniref:Uncharacterized protein n=1 Tax=Planotetraspora silvatica TaxID=234614 RepID=A0A8J3XS04_9ACTN|nr:hypothetical protein [Planotetraspora silvatica]GII50809.1 hypothetical protein Psi02_72330 [Planotetraspora silvatica]
MSSDDLDNIQSSHAKLYRPVINAIAGLGLGECAILYAPVGSGKSRTLASSIIAFLEENPRATILFVTDTPFVTQQARLLGEYKVAATMLRDRRELRNWMYHSSFDKGGVLIIANNLLRTSLLGALQGREFDLAIIDSFLPYRDKREFVLLTRAPRLVLVTQIHQSDPAKVLPEYFNVRHLLNIPSVADEEGGTLIQRTLLLYQISEPERKLITEGFQYFSRLRGEPMPTVRRAAESSRAAFSAALLASQYRRVAPGAHRILDRPRPMTIDEPAGSVAFEALEQRGAEEESLVPAWGISPPAPEDQVDVLLDRFDDLEDDNKLAVTLTFVGREIRDGRRIVISTQDSATADYVREYLDTNLPDVDIDTPRRNGDSATDTYLASSQSEVIVITDSDLAYLAEAPTGYVHLWFDPPSSNLHGQRRLEFVGVGGGVVYALMARPPFLNEAQDFAPFGFVDAATTGETDDGALG